MPTITTPLLIIGNGAAALVAAKVVAGRGVPCLLAGHEPIEDTEPVVLGDDAIDVLEPNGVLDVLRPYAAAQNPFAIAPLHFEQGLKHHCVADMLVTVYDRMWLEPPADDDGTTGVLTDGRSGWMVMADSVFDAEICCESDDLNAAISCGGRFAEALTRG